MNDHEKTREQLLEEVRRLRERVAVLEERRPTLIIRNDQEQQGTLEELRATEELNWRIIEAVPGGVVQVAHDGSVIKANATALRTIGLTPDGKVHRWVRDYEPFTIWEDGSPCPAADYPVNRCLQTGQPQPPMTIGVRRPDGQVRWGIYSAVPFPEVPAGQPTGALVTFLDITERKRDQETLQERESRLRLLLGQMPAVLWTTDFELRVTSAVGAGLAQLDKKPDQDVGLTLYEIFQTFDPTYLPLAAHLRALQGESVSYEMEFMGRWFHSHVEPLRAVNGAILGCIGVAVDFTERKRAEEAIRLAEEQARVYSQRLQGLSRRLLDVQEQERRHLARELHDEIGQVLTCLKLSLEMGPRLGAADVRARLGQAREQIRELTSRVRDLSLRLRPTMLDDLGLIPALLWHFERYTAQTQVRVRFEHRGLERRFPPELETAAYRIVQEALTNVARHARTDEARVRIWYDHELLSIQVEDGGAGFDTEHLMSSGRSSGLSGMHERAQLLGGRLTVESTRGAGTRVMAELPELSTE